MPSPAFQTTLVPTLTVSFPGLNDSGLVVTVSLLLEPEDFGESEPEEPQPATSARVSAVTPTAPAIRRARDVAVVVFTRVLRSRRRAGLESWWCFCVGAAPGPPGGLRR